MNIYIKDNRTVISIARRVHDKIIAGEARRRLETTARFKNGFSCKPIQQKQRS